MEIINKSSKIPIEEVLSSKGRIKVIKALVKGKCIVASIAYDARINQKTCEYHLNNLKEISAVVTRISSNQLFYYLDTDNKKIVKLIDFFNFWEQE